VRLRTLIALILPGSLRYVGHVNRLIAYLRENLILDFQGDLTVETVRELLAGDETRDARTLLNKLVGTGKIDEMMLILADCLLESVQRALTDDVMRDQLRTYIDS
jgi:hypothetical protein